MLSMNLFFHNIPIALHCCSSHAKRCSQQSRLRRIYISFSIPLLLRTWCFCRSCLGGETGVSYTVFFLKFYSFGGGRGSHHAHLPILLRLARLGGEGGSQLLRTAGKDLLLFRV